MMKKVLLALVKFYRVAISPYRPPCCRYIPTCSQYALEAIEKYGALKGGWLAFRRILRCNPFHKGDVIRPMRGGDKPLCRTLCCCPAVCQPVLRNADRPKAEMLRSAALKARVPLQFGGSIYVFNHRIRNLYPVCGPAAAVLQT